MTQIPTLEIPLPAGRNLGIGIVGAGTIVSNSHLPAYSEAGFRVVAIADRDPEKARTLARRFDVPKVYEDASHLFDDDEVEVVDLAVPPDNQKALALAAIDAGKHLQCHKPLAMTFADGLEIVSAARSAGVKLAVNQNARWVPAVRAAGLMLASGHLGKPTGAALDLGWQNDWDQMDGDWRDAADLTLRTDCIHHFDTCRYWFGEPEWVFATTWRNPLQVPAGDTRVIIALRYSDTLCATIRSNGDEENGPGWADWRLEGTDGIIRGTLAQYQHYGSTIPDGFEAVFRADPDVVYRPNFPFTTIPHAFMATMAQLLRAIESSSEAESSGLDNLRTLRLVETAVRSTREQRAVRPEEIHQLDGEFAV